MDTLFIHDQLKVNYIYPSRQNEGTLRIRTSVPLGSLFFQVKFPLIILHKNQKTLEEEDDIILIQMYLMLNKAYTYTYESNIK